MAAILCLWQKSLEILFSFLLGLLGLIHCTKNRTPTTPLPETGHANAGTGLTPPLTGLTLTKLLLWTHGVLAGYLVPAGSALLTPGRVLFSLHNWFTDIFCGFGLGHCCDIISNQVSSKQPSATESPQSYFCSSYFVISCASITP